MAWAVAAVVVVAAGLVVAVRAVRDRDDQFLTGTVVGPAGEAVGGATVASGAATATTDERGRFRLEGGPGWVTVRADGWISRTRAARPGDDVLVRLARDEPGTATFAFAGDIMFGRRYFDPDEDGDLDGLVEPDAGVDQHRALLDGVAPLLADADLTVVNLESPLVADPVLDPTEPRPPGWHPTKEFAFAGAPAAASALAEVGVDAVDLGNNHLYDRLDAGVASTTAALADAGFQPGSGFFGAGGSSAEAWEPAVREVGGQRVALLGCTSITGEEHALTYVATPDKAGAAACDLDQLRASVARAAATADVVVAMIHGGFEYGREPSDQVRELSDAAVDAGATLVVNHHPHVVGGLRFGGGRLTAWTLGNLLFDQTVWPTFESYVLFTAVRGGQVVGAWIEPLRLQGFRPTGVVGEDADWVARGALARSDGPWVVDDGSLWLDTAGAAVSSPAAVAEADLSVVRSGCAAAGGRDLLWTGDFEDRDLDDAPGVPLWNVDESNPDRTVTDAGAFTGERGVRLQRSGGTRDDLVLSPQHRVLVEPREELTLLLHSRLTGPDVDAAVQLSWYNDTKGSSQEQTVVPLPSGDGWQGLRIDVRAPPNAVAVLPFVRVSPPGTLATVDVDDVALVGWSGGCDYARAGDRVTTTAIAPIEASPVLEPVDATPVAVPAPAPLPPGPDPPEP
jgi:Bacterial capsule synthesis protein PGA_cap